MMGDDDQFLHDVLADANDRIQQLESALAAVRTDLSVARRLLDRFATGYCLSDLESMPEELSEGERALLHEVRASADG